MIRRELGTGWRGLAKTIGWLIAFGVEGLVIGLVVAALLGFLIQGGLNASWFNVPGLGQAVAQGAGLLVGFGVATYHIGHRLLGRSWEELRWRVRVPQAAWFGRGLGLGLLSAAAAMAFGLVVAGASWGTGEGSWFAWFISALSTAAALSLPALSEEVMFRGLLLVLLAGSIGRWQAIAVTSVLFGLSHWSNPDATLFGLANIALAGAVLGTAFYSPGGIWTAWGAHLGWNLSLAVLGAPVSGLPLAIPMIVYTPGGPDWLAGGRFGPEGGMLATIAMLGAIVVASRWIPKQEGAA